MIEKIDEVLEKIAEELIILRRQLHKIPELSRQEYKTQQFICQTLEKWCIEHKKVAGTGVYAIIRTGKAGKTIALRGDMDALAIEEQTQADFCSLHSGQMHACGHDAHMTFILGSVFVLNAIKDELMGNIVFLFQPAEERYGGAELMIEDGVLENPKVDAVIGAHVWNLPTGTIVAKKGPLMACPDIFKIVVNGKGGHGAMPHLSVNPIIPLSEIVMAINNISALYISPLVPTVASVCQIHAGNAYNVIPDSSYIEGTIRTFDQQVREVLIGHIKRAAEGICVAYGVECEFILSPAYPATINDEDLAQWAYETLVQINPSDNIIQNTEPSMIGEDFSYYGKYVPALFLWIGVQNEKYGYTYGLHHPKFNIDEQVLKIGVRNMCYLVSRYTTVN
jgi:amidohydrolase